MPSWAGRYALSPSAATQLDRLIRYRKREEVRQSLAAKFAVFARFARSRLRGVWERTYMNYRFDRRSV